MFRDENEPLALLVEISPKLAKKRFREAIYQAWDHQCAYCEAPATSLDHVIPKYKSGSSNRNNLVPCCVRCNANKGSSSIESWYPKQTFFCNEKFDKIKAWANENVISFFSQDLESQPKTA